MAHFHGFVSYIILRYVPMHSLEITVPGTAI